MAGVIGVPHPATIFMAENARLGDQTIEIFVDHIASGPEVENL